jgi:hypothetical protein
MTSTTTASLHVRFESATNRQEIPPDQYRQLLRELNAKQLEIVMFHRNWCKKAVIALKEGKLVEPYHVFLSGPGGVGKSHVIKLIYSDTLKFLRLSGAIEPDDVANCVTNCPHWCSSIQYQWYDLAFCISVRKWQVHRLSTPKS